jgi:hypothetical protein
MTTRQMARPARKRRHILDYLSRALVVVVALGLVYVAGHAVAMGIRAAASEPFVLGIAMIFMAAGLVRYGLRDE